MDYYNIWFFVVYLCDMKHFVKSVSSLMPLRLVMMAMLAVACGPEVDPADQVGPGDGRDSIPSPKDTVVTPPVDTVAAPVLEAGTTYYGYVRCGGEPVSDVVVTDGYAFTRTDAEGLYQLKSAKEYGFVEISVPSGYRVPSEGVIPMFFARAECPKNSLEQHDFELLRDRDQTRHTMLFFTDLHLANRINDLKIFTTFEDDINAYITSHPSENIFAATGGDMGWDTKWYQYNYMLPDYVAEVNAAFSPNHLQIFHAIGNHDHAKGKKGAYPAGELECSKAYKDAIGPTFYSYNIGQAHYICLDNIYCTNPGDGTTSYVCELEPYMLEWLKNDLLYVDMSKIIVLQMHAPLFTYKGEYYRNEAGCKAIIDALGGRRTYVLSGHTHMIYTTDHSADMNLIELNSGSVCGTWWWTGYYYPTININREGTPAGYRIFKVDGTDVSWQYKAFGRDSAEQFRTYDLNSIHITPEKYAPAMPAANLGSFNETMWKFTTDWKNNRFFILVYDYEPQWKIEAWEEGKPLTVTSNSIYDPLHLIAYEAVRYNIGEIPDSGYLRSSCKHWFMVVPSSPTSTVEIKVTDRFGRVYTETVKRPKEFSIEAYK